MSTDRILVLTGGTGTVKLLKGLNKLIPNNLDIITNNGDDFYYYGLKVCPDTDALVYALSGNLDESKMWGIKGDSFVTQHILQTIDGSETPVANWFNLGDKDLAYCLYRTFLLKSGKSLSEVVDHMKEKLSITPKIYPMSDTDITTYFTTMEDKAIHFEEFFIRLHSLVPIKNITFANVDKAKVSKDLILSIEQATLIIIGPSNPITSIGPILAIKDIKNAIQKSKAKKIIISPIIGREAFSGPAKTYMEARGIEVSPAGIYSIYKDIADEFYFDSTDEQEFGIMLGNQAREAGKKIFFADIIFNTEEKQVAFAAYLLKKCGIKN